MSDSDQFIPIIRPTLDEREAEAARRPILSGWVTQGPEVAAFESEFAEWVGAKYACAVSNCTAALHLALLAVGVKPGDEVITVSHSYIATANSIRYCGAIPVFVDIEADTYNMDPALVEPAITERTRAILCVHQVGMPCDLAQISKLAERHDLAIVEDAACAIGSEILWHDRFQKIGRPHGAVACFSFHPRKLLTTGDGGMLTTSDAVMDRRFRLWRQHGMSVPDTVRHESRQVVFETYPMLGYNYRMTDIQAAVGREQLKRLPEIIQRRRDLAARYTQRFSEIPGVTPPREPDWARGNFQSYCLRLSAECDQRTVMQSMLDAGVATRRGVMCAHREPAYATGECDRPSDRRARLSESERAQDQAILLPLFHTMTAADQDRVVAALRDAVSARGK